MFLVGSHENPAGLSKSLQHTLDKWVLHPFLRFWQLCVGDGCLRTCVYDA
jgi:hypothetical protein